MIEYARVNIAPDWTTRPFLDREGTDIKTCKRIGVFRISGEIFLDGEISFVSIFFLLETVIFKRAILLHYYFSHHR